MILIISLTYVKALLLNGIVLKVRPLDRIAGVNIHPILTLCKTRILLVHYADFIAVVDFQLGVAMVRLVSSRLSMMLTLFTSLWAIIRRFFNILSNSSLGTLGIVGISVLSSLRRFCGLRFLCVGQPVDVGVCARRQDMVMPITVRMKVVSLSNLGSVDATLVGVGEVLVVSEGGWVFLGKRV